MFFIFINIFFVLLLEFFNAWKVCFYVIIRLKRYLIHTTCEIMIVRMSYIIITTTTTFFHNVNIMSFRFQMIRIIIRIIRFITITTVNSIVLSTILFINLVKYFIFLYQLKKKSIRRPTRGIGNLLLFSFNKTIIKEFVILFTSWCLNFS